MTKPIPKVYATRFFQLVTNRQFAQAERILERVKQKMHVSERNRGYFQALYGMLLTQKNNNDRYAFLSGINSVNKKQLKHYRQEFLSHAESRLHADYDRGFFEAWADYMRILPKLDVSSSPTNSKGVTKTMKEPEAKMEAITDEETNDEITSEEKEKVEPATIVKTENKEEPARKKAEVELVKRGQSTLFDFAP